MNYKLKRQSEQHTNGVHRYIELYIIGDDVPIGSFNRFGGFYMTEGIIPIELAQIILRTLEQIQVEGFEQVFYEAEE